MAPTTHPRQPGTARVAAGEADVAAVLARFGVPLDRERRSAAGLSARCPLPAHDDRNPSWSINLGDGLWHCHGCGESGNLAGLLAAVGAAADAAEAWRLVFDEPEPPSRRSAGGPPQRRRRSRADRQRGNAPRRPARPRAEPEPEPRPARGADLIPPERWAEYVAMFPDTLWPDYGAYLAEVGGEPPSAAPEAT